MRAWWIFPLAGVFVSCYPPHRERECTPSPGHLYRDGVTYLVDDCQKLFEVVERCSCGCHPDGGRCQPNVCAREACGVIPDGCGRQVDCGGCDHPESCGGGATANICGCTPACAGRQCGDDGCGGTCGTCYSPEVCSAGHCCRPYGARCNTYFPEECCSNFCRSGFCDTW